MARGNAARKPEAAPIEDARRLGAFAANHEAAYGAGVTLLPTSETNAKKPLVGSFHNFTWRPSVSARRRWAERFPAANAAYLPGFDWLVISDCDDGSERRQFEHKFGQSPVVIESGSRGYHYPFKTSVVVPSKNLRRFGLDGDVKSQNSIVVAPGSIHPKTGRAYKFVEGSWADFRNLPEFNHDAYESLIGIPYRELARDEARRAGELHPEYYSESGTDNRNSEYVEGDFDTVSINTEGKRDDNTFYYLKARGARNEYTDLDQVLAAGMTYNREFNSPPLLDAEIAKTAVSVWKMIQEGRCFASGSGQYTTITPGDFIKLENSSNYGDAVTMLLTLKRRFGSNSKRAFPIAVEQMAHAESIPGWRNKTRYSNAKQSLLDECDLIECVRGPKRGHRVALYKFMG